MNNLNLLIGKIKNILKKIITLFLFVKNTTWRSIKGNRKKYPKVLQLPLTYKCNSRCVMCNVWTMPNDNEMTAEELGCYLKDPIFKNIKAVGINGGEPSLIKDIDKYVRVILKLPKIKSIHLISNGFNKNLLEDLKKIYALCKKQRVTFNVSISLDGVGEVHVLARRVKHAFENAVSTIDEIVKHKNKYCDVFDVACTVIKQNINHLSELDSYAKNKSYTIKYRLGIENKRINSDKIKNQYSVIDDIKLRQTAKEFFYCKFRESNNLYEKFKYFSIYYFLDAEKTKRLLGCDWKEDGITVDARGGVFYCAVASKKIGSLREKTGEKIFFDNKKIKYRMNLINSNCMNCIHDYSGKPEIKNAFIFLRHLFHEMVYCKIYKIKRLFV